MKSYKILSALVFIAVTGQAAATCSDYSTRYICSFVGNDGKTYPNNVAVYCNKNASAADLNAQFLTQAPKQGYQPPFSSISCH
jgi:hypothetical protein